MSKKSYVKNNRLPGPKSKLFLDKHKNTNLGWSYPYPFVQTNIGEGCFFKDYDGNTFLDFSSQIASNPLGYNHPDLLTVLQNYSHRTPIKCAGQDFLLKEHQELLNEILTILPKTLTMGFFTNSGAEAVENAIKLSFYHKPSAKMGISFESGFHGRTFGALSATNSKVIQKKHLPSLCFRHIPFDNNALANLERLLETSLDNDDIAFILLEPIQGEGGYNIATEKMITDVKKFSQDNKIFFISDEVQCGIGRTGRWWAIEHYKVTPDIITAAKALQVGATLSKKEMKVEPSAISSTWGGGHIIDLAMGLQIIKTIKKEGLLTNCTRMGSYIKKRLHDLSEQHPEIKNIRGVGLMLAFDLPTRHHRNNAILQFLQSGLVTLGCGTRGIRLIPPYIITKFEIEEAMEIIDKSLTFISTERFKHTGDICNYINCGQYIT